MTNQLAKCALLHLLHHCQCWVAFLLATLGLYMSTTGPSLLTHNHTIWHLGYCAAYKYMVTKKQHIPSAGFALSNFPALTGALKSVPPLTMASVLPTMTAAAPPTTTTTVPPFVNGVMVVLGVAVMVIGGAVTVVGGAAVVVGGAVTVIGGAAAVIGGGITVIGDGITVIGDGAAVIVVGGRATIDNGGSVVVVGGVDAVIIGGVIVVIVVALPPWG